MSLVISRSTTLEKGGEYFEGILKEILRKLETNPGTITTEDARRLSENVVVNDKWTAKVVSVTESYAAANEILHELIPQLGLAPQTSLLTIVNDLKAAVEQNPRDVTTEVLRTAQNVVSSKLYTDPPSKNSCSTHSYTRTEMQRAVGHTNAPHPELENEFREQICKIEPKVAEGTVTIEEANHLHSLEARAHGHTERGGITSLAQSVAAKRERQLSLSSGSSPISNRSRAGSKTFSSHELWRRDDAPPAEKGSSSKIEQGTAQPVISNKRHEALSDWTNVSNRSSTDDHDVSGKLCKMSLDSQVNNGLLAKDGVVSGNADGKLPLHKRENSQPIVEVK
jgi:hypothetical protein